MSILIRTPMWRFATILLGGYAFIALTYLSVIAAASAFPRSVRGELTFTKADAKTLLVMMFAWTITSALLLIVECADPRNGVLIPP